MSSVTAAVLGTSDTAARKGQKHVLWALLPVGVIDNNSVYIRKARDVLGDKCVIEKNTAKKRDNEGSWWVG